jgi:hypothetical protein
MSQTEHGICIGIDFRTSDMSCAERNLQDSPVSTATELTSEESGVESRQGHEVSLFDTASRLALRPIEPHVQ